jgi:lipopolysaccharide/colanic/teichoic acid biosynthesis glycosyltransferase
VRFAKRSIDVIGALVLLLFFGPWLPLIALAVYLDSPGPVLYRQRRVKAVRSRNIRGRLTFELFDMLKFRSMCVDAERATGVTLAAAQDPRVTRIGGFLRRTRLDELPQLFNVLRGDMSLVGPRPERPELFSDLSLAIPYFEERMRDVKPGITGLAQVSLGYTGRALPGSPIGQYEQTLIDPFGLELDEPSTADDMRMKLLFDLAYAVKLERLATYLRTELSILLRTPYTMLRGVGR